MALWLPGGQRPLCPACGSSRGLLTALCGLETHSGPEAPPRDAELTPRGEPGAGIRPGVPPTSPRLLLEQVCAVGGDAEDDGKHSHDDYSQTPTSALPFWVLFLVFSQFT